MEQQEVNISNAEMIVMRVIWSLGEAKADDVMNQVAARQEWSLATVKTLLGRLVKKKMLTTQKSGSAFIYSSTVSEDETIHLLTSDLLEKVCATKRIKVIANSIEDSELTKDDVESLIALLKRKTTVETVICTCLDDMGTCTCQHEHN